MSGLEEYYLEYPYVEDNKVGGHRPQPTDEKFGAVVKEANANSDPDKIAMLWDDYKNELNSCNQLKDASSEVKEAAKRVKDRFENSILMPTEKKRSDDAPYDIEYDTMCLPNKVMLAICFGFSCIHFVYIAIFQSYYEQQMSTNNIPLLVFIFTICGVCAPHPTIVTRLFQLTCVVMGIIQFIHVVKWIPENLSYLNQYNELNIHLQVKLVMAMITECIYALTAVYFVIQCFIVCCCCKLKDEEPSKPIKTSRR
jgi:hypothetical protein